MEEPNSADPGFFRLELEKEIYGPMDALTLKEDTESSERSVLQTGLAATFPVAVWKSSMLALIWVARWTATCAHNTDVNCVADSRCH